MRVATIPNAITGLRVVLAPVFLWLYATGNTDRALAAFLAAAATDALDGLAARLLDQRSALGAVLDAAADKLLLACALVALAWRGQLPWWLPALVVGRDALLSVGAAFLAATDHPMEISPTRLGKYATAVLAAAIVVALAAEFGGVARDKAAPWVAALGLLASLLVVASTVQYAYYFVRGIRSNRREAGSS
ncbi:MAG TPA: CDP-alcohol phosphatidyltransferase family protein [Anaeromyxobacteraceae bacterium]|nr:CDP-alcohol phosphatidyltransferase family protein [Anaeromyxobacteraceae bacterium]